MQLQAMNATKARTYRHTKVRVVTLLTLVAAFFFVGVARAQELVARELMDLNASTLITLDDIEYLRDAARFSRDQFESAQVLFSGARASLEQARRKELRASRAADEVENEEQQEKLRREASTKYVEDLASIERMFMQDVKGLLTPDQEEGWLKFERMRRRLLIRRTMDLQKVDLVSFLRRSVEDTSGLERMSDEVEKYEKDLDLLIQQRRPIAKDIGRNWFSWKHEGEKDDPNAVQNIRNIAAKICELQAATAKRWADLLPDGPRMQFSRSYFNVCHGGVGQSTGRIEIVRELSRVSTLRPEQKDSIKRIIGEADGKKMAMNWQFVKYWESHVVAELRNQPYPPDPGLGDYWTKVREIERAVIRDVEAVLTPEQIEAYKDGADLDIPAPEDRAHKDKDRRLDEWEENNEEVE